MARSFDDLLRSFRFVFQDLDSGYVPLTAVKIIPDGKLTGPGTLRISGAYRQALWQFLEQETPRHVAIRLFSDSAEFGSTAPDMGATVTIHLRGVMPEKAKIAPLELDATQSGIFSLLADLPYECLATAPASLLEEIAHQSDG